MGSRVDQSARKDCCKQVAKSIALLQHTGHYSSGPLWAVFQGRGCGITVQASHGDTKQGPDGEKFFVGLAETCSELQHDKQDVVGYEWPFTAVPVGCYSKEDRTDGAEHQYQCDAPCDICFRSIERFGQTGDRQRDGEEILVVLIRLTNVSVTR